MAIITGNAVGANWTEWQENQMDERRLAQMANGTNGSNGSTPDAAEIRRLREARAKQIFYTYSDITELPAGAQVLACRQETGEWLPAHLIRVNKNRSVRVEYLDGHRETKCSVRPNPPAHELEAEAA